MVALFKTLFGNKNEMQELAEARAIKAEINKIRLVAEYALDGRILSANTNWLNALGYNASEVVNEHHSRFIADDYSKSQEYRSFWQGLSDGHNNSGQYKLLTKKGDVIWVQGYYSPITGADGKVYKVISYLTDIHQEKINSINNEIEINRIRGAMNGASSAVMAIDRDFVVTYVNEATEKLFADNKEEFRKVFPTFDPSKIIGTCIDIFHKQPSHQRKMLADPSRLPFSTMIKVGPLNIKLHVTASLDKDGNYIGNILEWRDVSEEMDSIGQISAIHKTQGVIELGLDGTILKANDVYLNMLGYNAKDLFGKHVSVVLDPAYAKSPEYASLWQKLVDGGTHMTRARRLAKDGKEVWIQAYYNPILDLNGKPFKIVNYVTDITKNVEEEKENFKKAEFAMQIQNTLDSASINVMMADNDGIIRYMNPSTEKFLKDSASNFRKVLPNFDPNKVVGQNFDIFHKNPAHQRNLLANLKQTHVIEMPIGDLFIKLSVNPIYKNDGSRLGTVVEWTDVTEERNLQNEISNIVHAASNGDLTNRLNKEGKPKATAQILDSINSLLDKMTEIVVQVKEAGETINTAAGEISTGNNDLSSRTEQQASSLEETASSMEELASTVKQNAENAKQANQLAAAASGVAVKGGEVVANVVTTMSDINESSRKIEDIISVIDGIAFQTNILALNAAVEAARAGEQGRGFAVVAGEVRNLAQRSASAAKEIKELITDSVTKTAEGTKLVEDAGKTMNEIVTSVQRVTDIMGEISAASSEQSAGIDQVNTAITSMDEVTQQNAALVEEAAAAAESLVEQAASLMDTVNGFNVGGGAVERRAPNSPMRKPAPYASGRSSASSAPAKPVMAKTGTDDGDWEEF